MSNMTTDTQHCPMCGAPFVTLEDEGEPVHNTLTATPSTGPVVLVVTCRNGHEFDVDPLPGVEPSQVVRALGFGSG